MRVDSDFASALLPRQVLVDSPRVAALLDRYYDWEYRSSLGKGEVRCFRDKSTGGDGTGNLGDKYGEYPLLTKHQNYITPGTWHEYFHDNMTLDRSFEAFETTDGETFVEGDGYMWDTTRDITAGVELWAGRMNHVPANNLSSLDHIDEVRFIRILKQLYSAKGTNFVLRLLFNILFGEDVNFVNPKLSLARIDDNMVIDGSTTLIRDDEIYQEYSMVVQVDRDPSVYQEMLNKIYYPNFHPGGFLLTLVKK